MGSVMPGYLSPSCLAIASMPIIAISADLTSADIGKEENFTITTRLLGIDPDVLTVHPDGKIGCPVIVYQNTRQGASYRFGNRHQQMARVRSHASVVLSENDLTVL